MINYQSHTLSNGLRIIHKPAIGNVAYCGLFINAGTRDECAGEFGMAHFVEHMLFKGTTKRKAHHIINRMENVGGELNAYTNKEETVIYSVFLSEHFGRAIELVSDLVFNSVYPQNELDKEKEVVIDEIHSYEDNPSELICDEFENIVFKGSELGHNILGEEDSLLSLDTKKLKSFVEKHYIPANMVFFCLGNINFKKVIYLSEKYLSEKTVALGTITRNEPKINTSIKLEEKRDTSQVHAMIGARGYNIHDANKKVLHLLNNILGGPGMNSRLNVSLREKRGYVYNVDSNTTSYTDSGIFSIYFGCDKRNINKCVSLVEKELKRLKENKLTDLQLLAAKKQLVGQIGISSENRENVAMSLGKSFYHYNHFNSLEEIFQKINSISSQQIQDVANEIFDENNLFSLVYN